MKKPQNKKTNRPKKNKRMSLFYFATAKNGKTIKAVGLGKNDGSITLHRKHWILFITSLLHQIE